MLLNLARNTQERHYNHRKTSKF